MNGTTFEGIMELFYALAAMFFVGLITLGFVVIIYAATEFFLDFFEWDISTGSVDVIILGLPLKTELFS